MWPTWTNAVVFQIAWFLCVLGYWPIAVLALLVTLLIHQKYFVEDKTEWWLILGFGSLGVVCDSVIATSGLIQFSQSIPVTLGGFQISVAPIWLWCLWFAFATTLSHSLLWLYRYMTVLRIAAFIFVPLSYFTGAKISGSVLVYPWLALFAEGVLWLVILPLGITIAHQYWDRRVAT